MATAKQLAALKKARAARSKNLKKKAPAKKPATTTRKKNPICTDYVVYHVHRGRRYYFTGKTLDSEISKACTYANKYSADAASQVLTAFGKKGAVTKK